MEAETGFHVSRLIDVHVIGDAPGIPVPSKGSAHGPTSPAICAGLPRTRVKGGTSRVTIAPGSTTAPDPTRTPFRIVAFGPIHTSSSITTGNREISALGRPFPICDLATTTAIRT